MAHPLATNRASSFWNNETDSINYLAQLLEMPPSLDGLLHLSNVDKLQRDTQIHPSIASLYLQCAARQLMFSVSVFRNNAGVGGNAHEEKCKHMIFLIAETVGKVAPACASNANRSIISQSGILLALLHQMREFNTDFLSVPAVEFLQCALLAGQYRYAARLVNGLWPRPPERRGDTLDVIWLLRYFYLRGMIHVGCDDFEMAIRCFWTCLCVPSEVVSAITIDAWKKMVLCKAIANTTLKPTKQNIASILSPPPSASNAVSRFFSNSMTSEPQIVQQQQGDSSGIAKYVELIKADSREKFGQIKNQNTTLWEEDKTTGLVARLETELEYRWIQHQSKIFSVLPLSKLASGLGRTPEDTLRVLGLAGGIKFRQEDEYIVFDEIDDVPLPTANLQRLMQLAEKVRQLDVGIASSSKYQHIKGVDVGGRGGAGVEDF